MLLRSAPIEEGPSVTPLLSLPAVAVGAREARATPGGVVGRGVGAGVPPAPMVPTRRTGSQLLFSGHPYVSAAQALYSWRNVLSISHPASIIARHACSNTVFTLAAKRKISGRGGRIIVYISNMFWTNTFRSEYYSAPCTGQRRSEARQNRREQATPKGWRPCPLVPHTQIANISEHYRPPIVGCTRRKG